MIDQGHGLVRAYFISRIKCVAFAFKFIRQKKRMDNFYYYIFHRLLFIYIYLVR